MSTIIALVADIVTIVITGDQPEIGLTYNTLTGWTGTPKVDMGFQKRPQAPGAWAPAQTHPDEAIISIEGSNIGTAYGMSRADALLLREDLVALYNEGRPITMIVADDLRTTTREVMVEAITLPWSIHPDFDYSIDVRAEDPRRYGPPVTTVTTLEAAGTGLQLPYNEGTGVGLLLPSDESPAPDLGLDLGTTGVNGRITITNDGNTATVTEYTVSGGGMLDGFVIVNVTTGERLTYLGAVLAGTSIVLDGESQMAFINGTTPAGRWLSSPQWWDIPARSTIEVAFLALGPVTGNPTLTAVTPSAFL